MAPPTKIYTRTGDAGETALGNGARVAKHSARVAAYGTVDETNAAVGLARLHAPSEMDAALARIQNDLFDLGADLCRPELARDAGAEHPPLRVPPAPVATRQSVEDAARDVWQLLLKVSAQIFDESGLRIRQFALLEHTGIREHSRDRERHLTQSP